MQRAALLLFVFAPLLCCGCRQDTLPATVSGSITIDGQSLPAGPNIAGEVMLYPSAGGPAANGAISSDGQYVVQTGGTKGLESGEYKITVRVVEIEPEPPGGYQNAPGQKLISPGLYQDRDKSILIVDVKPGRNIIDLDLYSESK